MIDLRSDTLTRPSQKMRKAMYAAEVGDADRIDANGRSEDPTLNQLEEMAAELTGKEAAMLLPSGTMANLVALMTLCEKGQQAAVEEKLHVYGNEKAAFMERPGGIVPVFFKTDRWCLPEISSIKKVFKKERPKLLCLENTHNFGGGLCLPLEKMEAICTLARENSVQVHLDGARINNAAIYLNTPVAQLAAPVDTVMFCLSKGLGAPVGSLLCGSRDFILAARDTRKTIGGGMRQAGVIAAAGIVAIREQRERLVQDHENAYLLAEKIAINPGVHINLEDVQTNIIRVDISPSGISAEKFQKGLEVRGLKVNTISEKLLRFVTYREIQKKDILEAAEIFNRYCDSL